MNLNGEQFPLKTAFANYLKRWYDGLYGATKSGQEFIDRGFSHSCQWVPGRLVDSADQMLAAYQKNDNAPQGKNTKFPVVLVGMAKDYAPMSPDWGGRSPGRKLVRIVDGGSAYGYRQAGHEVRAQVVIMAADVDTAKSLAAQFCLFVGEFENRSFKAVYEFGGHPIPMPTNLETPDVVFMAVGTDQKNITILAADLMLKANIPYFDAPKAGEPNDGSTNVPPGYPLVSDVIVIDEMALIDGAVSDTGTVWQ